ncbi:MAG: nucleotidyltransferase domain-containing protein [Candidatus Heimdallarchaeota archaeon]|nr:nucleotidyltransferase domain-containing protein [Candidatus Heimdallarchaeota archaeon]
MNTKVSIEKKTQIRERYEQALDNFVKKAKQDPYVIAVILAGSLAYYDVGEDSNLDILIVVKDEADSPRGRRFTEDNIEIDASVLKRNDFKRLVEGTAQGGMFHSFFSKGKILHSTDETIQDYIKDSNYFGKKDREVQLLNHYSWAFYNLYKTRKFLYVIGDVYGSYSFYMEMVRTLARIEVTLSQTIPLREVIQQALKLNPAFFEQVFTEASDMKKTEENITKMIQACEEYLDDQMEIVYKPVLDYLADAQEFRTHQEILDHFSRTSGQRVFINCREIVRRGWVLETVLEKRLTNRSKPLVEEPAYLYDSEAMGGEE